MLIGCVPLLVRLRELPHRTINASCTQTRRVLGGTLDTYPGPDRVVMLRCSLRSSRLLSGLLSGLL